MAQLKVRPEAETDALEAAFWYEGERQGLGLEFSDALRTTPYSGPVTMPAADITAYAKWTANSYTITFNSNGGSSVTAITAPYGSTISAPAAPTKTGYTFAGWYSDVALTTAYTFTTMPAGNTTAYAKWTALMPVYRFYNVKTGTHFYTASEAEKNNVIVTLSLTYRLEGIAYYVNTTNPDNGDPLYRFYNAKKGVHFYTASEAEKNNVLATLSSTYRLESVGFYLAP